MSDRACPPDNRSPSVSPFLTILPTATPCRFLIHLHERPTSGLLSFSHTSLSQAASSRLLLLLLLLLHSSFALAAMLQVTPPRCCRWLHSSISCAVRCATCGMRYALCAARNSGRCVVGVTHCMRCTPFVVCKAGVLAAHRRTATGCALVIQDPSTFPAGLQPWRGPQPLQCPGSSCSAATPRVQGFAFCGPTGVGIRLTDQFHGVPVMATLTNPQSQRTQSCTCTG